MLSASVQSVREFTPIENDLIDRCNKDAFNEGAIKDITALFNYVAFGKSYTLATSQEKIEGLSDRWVLTFDKERCSEQYIEILNIIDAATVEDRKVFVRASQAEGSMTVHLRYRAEDVCCVIQ